MAPSVFIHRVARFLPNRPVPNSEMEKYLGLVGGRESRSKAVVLRRNGIVSRHYAIDENGKSTHSNARMTAEAVRALFDENFASDKIDLLCCGTSTPDQLLPSHASAVHGELGLHPMEALAFSGACNCSMNGLKYAFMALKTGSSRQAVVTGSERMSGWMQAKNFEEEATKLRQLENNPVVAFEKDFLRWMLSDGAAALGLSPEPPTSGTAYRLDWIETRSFANQLPTCMYAGAEKNDDGQLVGWREFSQQDRVARSVFAVKQDIELLDKWVVAMGVRFYGEMLAKHDLSPERIDYFLPHLSSAYFEPKTDAGMVAAGLGIPKTKWFSTLAQTGNIGSAAVFTSLEELPRARPLKEGQRVILFVPESARFSYGMAQLTVVRP